MMVDMITLRHPRTDEQVCVQDTADNRRRYKDFKRVAKGAPMDDEAVISGGKWVVPLEVNRRRRWEQVKELRQNATATLPTRIGDVDGTLASLTAIGLLSIAARSAQDAGEPWETTFTLADDSGVKVDAAKMLDVAADVANALARAHELARGQRDEIVAANTQQKLNNVGVEAAWRLAEKEGKKHARNPGTHSAKPQRRGRAVKE